MYQPTLVDDGYRPRRPGPTIIPDYQPPYFPPPYPVPQPSTGAASAVVEFVQGSGGPPTTPRHFPAGANVHGYASGLQPQNSGLLLSPSSIDQVKYNLAIFRLPNA